VLTGAEIGKKLDLHPRGIADFLDALVAMKFLERDGDGPKAKYFNTPATALYLDRNSPRYIGGIPEMLNSRLFKYWHDLNNEEGGKSLDYLTFTQWTTSGIRMHYQGNRSETDLRCRIVDKTEPHLELVTPAARSRR